MRDEIENKYKWEKIAIFPGWEKNNTIIASLWWCGFLSETCFCLFVCFSNRVNCALSLDRKSNRINAYKTLNSIMSWLMDCIKCFMCNYDNGLFYFRKNIIAHWESLDGEFFFAVDFSFQFFFLLFFVCNSLYVLRWVRAIFLHLVMRNLLFFVSGTFCCLIGQLRLSRRNSANYNVGY